MFDRMSELMNLLSLSRDTLLSALWGGSKFARLGGTFQGRKLTTPTPNFTDKKFSQAGSLLLLAAVCNVKRCDGTPPRARGTLRATPRMDRNCRNNAVLAQITWLCGACNVGNF